MIKGLEEVMRIIKVTMQNRNNAPFFPYFFIVGAGISVPEIPTAKEIIQMCKDKAYEQDPESFHQFEEVVKGINNDPMKNYSKWIEFAYPNRIDRSNLFKELNSKAKISSANLILAQILGSKIFANTVFTTNFDDSIKRALSMIGVKDYFSAENPMDNLVINNHTKDIQIVHVHGTFNFYDCANLEDEISSVAAQSGTMSSTRLLASFFVDQAPIILGYSGWENDTIMRCIKERISYPTPLQYIWICHSRANYDQLPSWLKESPNMVFALPDPPDECGNKECGDTSSFFQKSNNLPTIDATKFLKRIVSEFKISSPIIFEDPYRYFYTEIATQLPKNEDVLHLQHWARRLKLIANNSNKFEVIVREMETLYLSKDFYAAANKLRELTGLPLIATDIEFVCTLITEYIDGEDLVNSIEERVAFHEAALDFIEHNLQTILNSRITVKTLKAILFIQFKYKEKEKITNLLLRVQHLAYKYPALLEVDLTSLGVLSTLSNKNEQEHFLRELILRCPKETKDSLYTFLRYRAYSDLSNCLSGQEAINCLLEAEQSLQYLQDDDLEIELLVKKAKSLHFVEDISKKNKWMQEIETVLEKSCIKCDKNLYIELASIYFEYIDTKQKGNVETAISICSNLLLDYEVNTGNCKEMLEYIKCCTFVIENVQEDIEKLKYSKKALPLIRIFPHECASLTPYACRIFLTYLSLPMSVVLPKDKANVLHQIKKDAYYYQLLEELNHRGFLDELSEYQEEYHTYHSICQKFDGAYLCYCQGKFVEAEQGFVDVANCAFQVLSDLAKTNLLFMIRRGETQIELSFWNIYNQKVEYSCYDDINVVLHCMKTNDTDNPQYAKSMENIINFDRAELESVSEWWGKIEIVGEEESKIVLSLLQQEQK